VHFKSTKLKNQVTHGFGNRSGVGRHRK
jgi:hypothetical protein